MDKVYANNHIQTSNLRIDGDKQEDRFKFWSHNDNIFVFGNDT